MTAVTNTSEAFDRFVSTLDSRGVRAALAGLLELTDYRFIGIFRFQHGMASAAVHIDRENPEILSVDAVPDTATYCCFVRDSRGSFITADALLDHRLTGHPARAAVRGYCGVPVMDSEGTLLGTLCHYDVLPRDPEQINLLLMLQVASAIAQRGAVPPYPRLPHSPDQTGVIAV